MAIVAAMMGLAMAAQAAAEPAISGAGTISVVVAPESGIGPPLADALAEGVGSALAEADFLVLPGRGAGRYIATVALNRREQGSVTAPGSATASTSGVANWGAGARITLPTHKEQVRALMLSTLTLRIVSRHDGRLVWTGSALTAQVDGSRDDAPAALGRKLTRALIARYPAPVEGTVSVP